LPQDGVGGAIDIDSETELSKRKDLFNLLRVFHFLRIEWGVLYYYHSRSI
jgi:hypothetical protein